MQFTKLFCARPRVCLGLLAVAIMIGLCNWQSLSSRAQSAQDRMPARSARSADNVREEIATAELIGPAPADASFDLIFAFEVRQRQELDRLVDELHDVNSPNYRQWLTPDEFGNRFGLSAAEYERAEQWLRAQGFEITARWPSRLQINFRGNNAQINTALRTNINLYRMDEQVYFANDARPQLPDELAQLVTHIHGLESFSRVEPESIEPNYRVSNVTGLGPKDFYRVYNLDKALTEGIDGLNQKIGIVARSNFKKKDINLFRERFGLAPGKVKKIFPYGAVRNLGGGEETEVLLDTQWAGAVAPAAEVVVVIAPDVDQSLQYFVNSLSSVKIISISFGLCEQRLGDNRTRMFHDLYTQAAAQGQTVFVSSGDFGANDCNDNKGRQVNGLASSPNCIAVGGTSVEAKFDDNGDAVEMTGERVWRGGGGGTSTVFAKPAYQRGVVGVAEEDRRSLPDISQIADPNGPGAWIARKSRLECCIGGTSLAAPIWAGFLALVQQQHGPVGNFNFRLYEMGAAQQAGQLPAVFNDTVKGDNSFGGVDGFDAINGYDRASGWGTFNGYEFLKNYR